MHYLMMLLALFVINPPYLPLFAATEPQHETFMRQVLAPDGSIFVMTKGHAQGFPLIKIIKFAPSGALDLSFGANGLAVVKVEGQAAYFQKEIFPRLTIGFDGSLYVAGLMNKAAEKADLLRAALEEDPGTDVDLIAMKLTPAGNIDSKWVPGGILVQPISLSRHDEVGAINVDEKQRLVIAILRHDRTAQFTGLNFFRITADGYFDDRFGKGGAIGVNAKTLHASRDQIVDIDSIASQDNTMYALFTQLIGDEGENDNYGIMKIDEKSGAMTFTVSDISRDLGGKGTLDLEHQRVLVAQPNENQTKLHLTSYHLQTWRKTSSGKPLILRGHIEQLVPAGESLRILTSSHHHRGQRQAPKRATITTLKWPAGTAPEIETSNPFDISACIRLFAARPS